MKNKNDYLKLRLLGMGWKGKLIFKRATAYISINKLVVEGCNLEKGNKLKSYIAEDSYGRKVVITYLDGKKANKNI
ncbi:MAG: hypothetical protein ACOC1P_05405 [Minisyncoccales bacterium]